jgi:hypothetical protein
LENTGTGDTDMATIEIKASVDGYYLCGSDSESEWTPDGPYGTESEARADLSVYAEKCGFVTFTVTQD